MLLECLGVQMDKFYLPSFEVKEGDFVLINLFMGGHHRDLSAAVVDILTGNTKNESVKIHTHFTFAKRIEESKLRKYFYPLTVGEYLRKNANPESPFCQKIYEQNYIHEQTKTRDLSYSSLLKLSIYSILSYNQPIIFPLAHTDPLSAKEIYKTVLEYAQAGGTAILVDWGSGFNNKDVIYVEIAKMDEDGKGHSPIYWEKPK